MGGGGVDKCRSLAADLSGGKIGEPNGKHLDGCETVSVPSDRAQQLGLLSGLMEALLSETKPWVVVHPLF